MTRKYYEWKCMGPAPTNEEGVCEHGERAAHIFYTGGDDATGTYMLSATDTPTTLAAHKSEGKPLVGDIDPTFILAVGEVLAASIGKYPNDADGKPNWWKGGSYRGFAASVTRHMAAWASGHVRDEESGLSHLAHAACDIMFLASWQARGVGQDDRLV